MLTYVVADIHGRLDLLDLCLAAIKKNSKKGRVIFTGDFIDRGPDSRGVIQRLIDGPDLGWKWDFIRGNHEDMLLEAILNEDTDTGWIQRGGAWTIASYAVPDKTYEFVDPVHLDWINALPRLLWDDQRVYTHAAVSQSYELHEQPERVTQWFRYPEGLDIGYRGRHVVHGHNANDDGPELFRGRTNLDTAGVWTGRMVVGVFDDKSGPPIDLINVKGPKLS